MEKVVASDGTIDALVKREIKLHGPNCSLNHIDVSNVKYMHAVFYERDFNGDISQWDISKVKDVDFMFYESQFKGDLRPWNWTKKQMVEAFRTSFPAYLEARQSILEHEKLKESFCSYNTTKRTRVL